VLRLLDERGLGSVRALDLACGTGTLAIALAARGHHVVGIDRSPEMIRVARDKTRGRLNPTFEVGDMRGPVEETIPGPFDLVTCAFDAVNYLLSPDDLAALFATVSDALVVGGLFVFDANPPLVYQDMHCDSLKRSFGEGTLIQELGYDGDTRTARTTFRFPNGAIEVHTQRAYDLEELTPGLRRAGLRVVEAYASFDLAPVTAAAERLICVCEKAGAALGLAAGP